MDTERTCAHCGATSFVAADASSFLCESCGYKNIVLDSATGAVSAILPDGAFPAEPSQLAPHANLLLDA